jgi:hypothetical protein
MIRAAEMAAEQFLAIGMPIRCLSAPVRRVLCCIQQRRCTMQLAAVLFGLAALGGATLAGIRLSGRPRPPTWMALGHGGIAAAALVTLIYAATSQTLPTTAHIALGGFVLAALGGIGIFTLFHLRDKPLPIPLVMGHGLVAVTSFVLLLIALLG